MDPRNPNSPPQNPDDSAPGYDAVEQRNRELFGGEPKKSDTSVEDAAAVNKQENDVDQGPIQGGLFNPSAGGKKERRSVKQFALSLIKKRSPFTIFVVMLLGGGGFALLLTPGLGLLQLKETLLGDLNDQLSAVDIRTNALWKSRLKSLEANSLGCNSPIKIKCKFGSFGTKQLEKMKANGFTFDETDTAFGRKTISNFKAPDGTDIPDPATLRRLVQNDPGTRSALTKVFNPLYASLSDSTFMKTLNNLKTSKARTVTGTTNEELEASLRESTDGDALDGANARSLRSADGREYIYDEDGTTPVYKDEDPDKFNSLTEAANAKKTDVISKAKLGGKAVNGVLSGAVKGANIIGFIDSACSVYNLSRSIGAAAKVARSLQAAQYFMEFMKAGDDIIEGDATPEKVAFFSEKLAATNTQKMILDTGASSDATKGMTEAETREYIATHIQQYQKENPDFGKSGFDADAYKVVAYNDAPIFSDADQQFMVAGGFVGKLSEVTDQALIALGGSQKSASETCGVVQSWWVRGAGLAIGIIAGAGSLGLSTVLSIGGSIAVSVAIPIMEAMLTDIIAGKVTEGINGTESMTAAVVGGSVVYGQAAQARGMKPLTSAELEGTLAVAKETQAKYAAIGRYDAATTPFDITNQYSFLGSLARTVNIPLTKAASSVSGSLSAVPALLSASLASIVPSASAATAYNPDRFNKCKDVGYAELGIAADIFCNIRYGLSQTELNMDPYEAMDYLLENNQIDDNGKVVGGSEYEKFIKYCGGGRQEGFGETGEEGAGTWGTGEECMKESPTMSYYRVYTIDKSIDEAMDEEGLEGQSASPAVAANGLVSPLNPEGIKNNGGFGPRVPPIPGASSWHQGDDLDNDLHPEVRAIMAGTVISADNSNNTVGSGGNNIVQIQHADGLISSYWHMPGVSITVKDGDPVTAGQQLGIIGSVGQSSGPHLHIELDISKVQDRDAYTSKYVVSTGGYNPGQRIEPTDYFKKNGVEGFK